MTEIDFYIARGYGMKINRIIWRHKDTLYSYMDALRTFPSDPAASAQINQDRALLCDPVKNNIDRTRNPFFFNIPAGSYVSKLRDGLPFVTVVRDDNAELVPGVGRVDIAVGDLCRFANIVFEGSDEDLDLARCFCDCAIAAGAASMLVVRDEWFCKKEPARSVFQGVLLINAEVFLEHVIQKDFGISAEEGETEVGFRLPYSLGTLNNLTISVNLEPVGNGDAEVPVECNDLSLVDPRMRFEKGYQVSIRDQYDDSAILTLIFNVSPTAPMGSSIGAPLLGARAAYKRKAAGD